MSNAIQPLLLLSHDELTRRLTRLRSLMADAAIDAILVTDHADQYYLTGRVFEGFVFVDAAEIRFFIRRPVELSGENVVYIRKPEDIPAHIDRMPATIGLEMDLISYSQVTRLAKAFAPATPVNANPVIRDARSVKTEAEQALARRSGVMHAHVYRKIPGLYRDGMSDIELQVEIERISRLEGCLGQFRISGSAMELFMGNIICGDNADAPSPYDFAMGGAGQDPSLPVGANGTDIHAGMTVMVDMNGNFTGYMTDMTRVYTPRLSDVPDLARKAHDCSIRIHRDFCDMARPGVEAKVLYERAVAIVAEEGLGEYFMGHRQKAGFIGHGVGIEINELPVIAPRSRDLLRAGNIIALEPKFVIPHVGAVGIENTYIIHDDRVECITLFDEQLMQLD